MLINLRNALMAGKRIPYDAEVEYLESTGTQWIDTGVKPTSDTQVEITYKQPAAQSNVAIFGSRTAYNDRSYCIWTNANGYIRFDYSPTGSYSNANGPSSVVGDFVVVKKNGRQNFVNGTEYTANTAATFTCVGNAYLFAINNNGTADFKLSAQISACKIYDANGTLVRDFIPVRKGTVGYLYDRVSGKLFGNAGTGDFVLGPDVVPVEYIESHGTEWIDTGFNITNATSFSYDAKFSLASTISNSEPRLFSNEGAGSGAYYDIYFVTSTNILNIRQSGTTAQISRRDVPIVSTMDEQGNYRGYYEDEPQSLLYNATRAFVAPTTDRDYRIFSRGNNTSSQFLWQGKLYWLNFTKNGEPSRRYRPVRVGTDATSWEGAMMDTLTRRIYRNAGKGAFSYGNDLKYPIPAA